MTPARFEPTISTDERPQTYALDCAATGNVVGLVLRNVHTIANQCHYESEAFFFTPTTKFH
jgi:hypothetical protein